MHFQSHKWTAACAEGCIVAAHPTQRQETECLVDQVGWNGMRGDCTRHGCFAPDAIPQKQLEYPLSLLGPAPANELTQVQEDFLDTSPRRPKKTQVQEDQM